MQFGSLRAKLQPILNLLAFHVITPPLPGEMQPTGCNPVTPEVAPRWGTNEPHRLMQWNHPIITIIAGLSAIAHDATPTIMRLGVVAAAGHRPTRYFRCFSSHCSTISK